MGRNGQVVIPKPVREMLELKKWDNVIFEMKNNEVVIKAEKKYY